MSFNIQGLPIESNIKPRFLKIAKVLLDRASNGNAPDVVLIQEAFVEESKLIKQISGYPYELVGVPGAFPKIGSGLRILSRHPILNSGNIIFSQCVSWDCFARKGAQWIRIQPSHSDRPIVIFNTHLNSDLEKDRVSNPLRPSIVRSTQVAELVHKISDVVQPNDKVIVGGDFNFRLGSPNHSYFASLIGLSPAVIDCKMDPQCQANADLVKLSEQSIDHFFSMVNFPSNFGIPPISIQNSFNTPIDGLRVSDHMALEVQYQL